jgi:type IV pilus assembly protein PilO
MASFLPSDQKQQVRLLIGVLPFGLLFLFYNFVLTGRAEVIETVQTHVEDLEMKNNTMRAVVAQHGTELPRRLATLEAHVAQLEQLIPRREDVPFLINQITQSAQQLGVEMAALTPLAEEAGEHYSRQTYEIHVLGEYHAIGEYLTAIGSLSRIIRPTAVTIQVEQGDPTGRTNPRLRAGFRIETYITPNPALPASAPNAT